MTQTPTPTPLVTTGRITVNDGDDILSSWGNTTFDQTIECFASPADRDAQWASPHDGAACYTADTGRLWLRRNGAWIAVPRGPIGHVLGPASTVTIPASFTAQTILTVAVPVIAACRYRVTVAALLNIGGSSGTSTRNALQVTPVDMTMVAANTARVQISNQAFGAALAVNGAFTYTAPTTATVTFTLAGMIDLGGTVAANGAELTVDDIGQW